MSMSLKELLALFSKETLATLYMVSISTLISYAIGIPLGVILVVTEEGSIAPNKMMHGMFDLVQPETTQLVADKNIEK